MSQFFRSTVGKKVVMAMSGAVLFGFVVAHMAGNLTVYQGARAMNDYAHFLHTVLHGAGIWIARAILVVSISAHVWAMWALTLTNRRARTVPYKVFTPRVSSYASRTMRWSGSLLLAFLVFHLLHLTTGDLHAQFVAGDPYHNVTTGLRAVPIASFYVAANLALGMHLFHGASSMLQTLGLSHPRYNATRNGLGAILALVVVTGNISFPLFILAGIVE